MKPSKNLLKSTFVACAICFAGLFFNSCQTSSEEIFLHSSSELFTKDSKIVSLFIKAVGGETTTKSFSKSTLDETQCTQFVYPMTFYAYTGDDTEPTPIVINNDEEFVAFLTSLTSGDQFFITYPVTLIDIDDNLTVIRDYPDLVGILTMLVNACEAGDDGSGDDGSGDDGSGDDGSGDDGSGDDGSGDDGSGDDSSGDDSSGDDDSADDASDNDGIVYEYCGNGNNKNKKVTICHNGNTICISINAIWGHMAHHADDYFGSCSN